MSEFRIPKGENPSAEEYNFKWLYTNGLLAVIFSFGVLFTSLKSRRSRSSMVGPGLSSFWGFGCQTSLSTGNWNWFVTDFRMVTKFHYGLWSSFNGTKMECIYRTCTSQGSFRSSQETPYSCSLGVFIPSSLDRNPGQNMQLHIYVYLKFYVDDIKFWARDDVSILC